MLRLLSAMAVMVLVAGCATVQIPAVDAVLIDGTEASYTVYAGIPKDKVDAVKVKLRDAPPGARLVAWDDFVRGRDKYVTARIVKNEYPGSRAEEGVVALIRKYPGTPIGLAWNGGIAITYNDYQHARRTYEQYKEDPALYEKTRNRDPRADPVNPAAHLGPLLGW